MSRPPDTLPVADPPSRGLPGPAGTGSDHAAVAALIGVQLLFGTLPVVAKHAFVTLGTSGVACMRIAGALAVFTLLARVTRAPALPRVEQPFVILLAVLGVTANQLLFLFGLARTSATHAALITATIPVLTPLAAALLGRERLGLRRSGGIALALVGVLVLLLGKDAQGHASIAGDLMILTNASVYALYLVLSKDLMGRFPPLTALPWLFGWGLLTSLPFTGLPAPGPAPTSAWLSMAYIVLGPTVGTYGLNLFALQRVPASVVAIFIYLQPFVAGALAWPLLGEAPTLRMAVSALITFVGVRITSTAPRQG